MSGKAILDRFIQKNPLAVMTRWIAQALMGEQLDQVFQQNRSQQYDDTIKFSTVAVCMAEIALGTVENRNQADLLEDAHAQESTVLDRVVEDLSAKDLVIADRPFCIVRFLLQLAARSGFFVIRQHGRLKGKLLKNRKRVGKTDCGTVYEQALEISEGEQTLVVRRITIELVDPTRDGDKEIHLLSNVPATDANGCELAELYRDRWEIENAFYL